MDWSKGYTSSYYMTLVDPITWRDTKRIEITGGTVSRSLDGLRESASIECETFDLGIEQWVRVWLTTNQSGSSENVPMFTGLASHPSNSKDGVIEAYKLDCYSVLKAVDDVFLVRGWYAPAGSRGVDIIKTLLAPTKAPINPIEDESPRLLTNIIAEDDETNLTMIDKILDAMGDWELTISGDGSINIGQIDTEPKTIFGSDSLDIIETSLSIDEDWFSCPNVLMVINDDLIAIARDDSDTSEISTVNRGREVWARESGVDLASGISLEEYATKKLKELQKVYRMVSYDRRFVPDILPGDYIRLNYPGQDLDGIYTIESQSIDLSYSAKTSETVAALVDEPISSIE